ncbi:MAG: hypothetical protein BRC51_14315 [Cyanobacteria bacterium SW_12_48_29]|nr:MAG: hypothetical protein BRC51_14315 [Cyanobacteria bacterium SW_12_48_29]
MSPGTRPASRAVPHRVHQATFDRFGLLLLAAIFTPGRRTVTHVLATVPWLMCGHFSSYHRVLSQRRWSLWPLARVLAQAILAWIPSEEPVLVAMDEHATQHRGKQVFGKDKHRDAVRSSHSQTVWLWGHKWVVLDICVQLPFASRPWALPVWCALYRSPQLDRAAGQRHQTPLQLARGLMATLGRWFPERRWVLLGDGGLSSHQMARFGHRHPRWATVVGKLSPQANLYRAPPVRRPGQTGRPRLKGEKLPSPASPN